MQVHEVIALLSVSILIIFSSVSLFFCLFYICDRDFRRYFNQELRTEICGKTQENSKDRLKLLTYA